MGNEEGYSKLINIVDEKIKSGSSRSEVADLLVKAGVPEEKVDGVIDIVLRSRSSNLFKVARFFFLSIVVAVLIVPVGVGIFGKEAMLAFLKPALIIFLLSGVIFSLLSIWKTRTGKAFRCIFGWSMYFSSATVTGLMFVHPGWETGKQIMAGQGAPVAVVVKVFYQLGPVGIAWAMLVLSAMLLMNVWGACHEWRTGENL